MARKPNANAPSPPNRSRAVRREVRELSLLFEISQTLDIRDAVHPVLAAMANHMGMVNGTLLLLDPDTGEISIEAAHGLSSTQQARGRYRVGEGVTGRVVETGRPAVVPRISTPAIDMLMAYHWPGNVRELE